MNEEIKQRIVAKTGKIKRFSNRINQYRQNRLFQNNRHRFYQELNEQNAQSRKLKIVQGCELSPEEVEVIKKLENFYKKKEKDHHHSEE